MRETERRRRLLPKPSIEDEIARLSDLDLKALRVQWRNAFGKPAPEHLTRYLLFRIIAYRLQADRFGDLDAETLKVLKQAAGQEGPIFSVSETLARLDQRRFAPPPGTVLHGTVRRSTACPRSPLPSPGPNGTVPASLACGTGGPRSMAESQNEVSTRNWQGPLRDLYEGLDRPGSRAGFQLAGCPVRGRLGLHQKPGACRLDFGPVPL